MSSHFETLKYKLDKILQDLKSDATSTFLVVRRAMTEEHSHYVNAYLWWYAARELDGYLENLYKSNGIVTRKIKSGINFRPLLNLLSDGEITGSDLILWTKCLNKLHEEFEENKNHYEIDVHKRLCHFIANNGGKTGLAAYHGRGGDVEEIEDSSSDADEIKAMFFELDESEFETTLISEAKKFYAANKNNVNFPSAQTSADGYSVVLIKKGESGSKFIGSSDRLDFIDRLISSIYRCDFNATPVSLRTVLEPLHLLNVPNAASKYIDKYIEFSNVSDVEISGKKRRAHKRLIYRKDSEDFLLSSTWVDSSPVLIAKPKYNIFEELEADMALANDLRRSLEVRLLHQSMFNLFAVENDQKFLRSPDGYLSRFKLSLKTKLKIEKSETVTAEQIIAATDNLSHVDITWRGFFGFDEGWQVDLKNKVQSRCTWHGNLSLDGIRIAANNFFKQWIDEYSKISNRSMHNYLILNFNESGLGIEYEFGKDGNGSKSIIEFDGCVGDATLNVRSTDFSFVLRQVADLDIDALVKFSASTHGVILKFSTSIHHYQIAIPSCNTNLVRDNEFFSQYIPTLSELKKSPEIYDEHTVEYKDFAQEQSEINDLIEAVKRLKKL